MSTVRFAIRRKANTTLIFAVIDLNRYTLFHPEPAPVQRFLVDIIADNLTTG